MKTNSKKIFFSLLTLMVVIVWGTSFASSKVLMDAGLDTIDILLLSFIVAYLSALAVSHKKLWSDNIRDEVIHLFCGLIGGAGYYLAQVEALKFTMTTNVSIIISAAPILTAILSYVIFKERFTKMMIIGTVIALTGAILVVFNGKFELDINPMGNILSISAAAAWALYSVFLKILGEKYSVTFTIRKVFFYGTVGLLIYSLFNPLGIKIEMFTKPVVIGNILYLGLISSMVCYMIWSMAVNELGPTKTANFMYVQPFATLIVGYFLLSEPISFASIIGLFFIISGVYLTERVPITKEIAN